MSEWLAPIGFTLFVWWFGTGAILYLVGLPPRTHRWGLAAGGMLLAGGLWGLWATRGAATVAGAYLAFASAIAVWSWLEIAFLLGWITGPHRLPCPPGARGWPRLKAALAAVWHHELALLALLALVAAIGWGAANPVGAWAFAILAAMRVSAKLNLFLGVRNLGAEWLPPHLAYLGSHFRRAPLNPLFPVSVLAATVAACSLWQAALGAPAGTAAAVGLTLLACLLSLGLVEHWFMVLPLPTQALWQWGLRSRTGPVARGPAG
jgi:putative photosynthetic complex assembly protein 2